MLRKIAIGLLGAVAVTTLAAQTFAPDMPIVGGASYCNVTVNTNCTQTIPAGPSALTGLETLPIDLNATPVGGQQSAKVPVDYLAAGFPRNALVGGDFQTNAWQRGTSFASITPSTGSFTADRWMAYSSGNTATVNRQTSSTDVSPTLAILASMRIVRPSGTNTTAINLSQLLDTAPSARFLGRNAVLSFYARANSGYLQTNQTITAAIAYHTTADSLTGGANSLTFAAGTITGYQAATVASPFTTTAVLASNVATIPLNSTWTRYAVVAPIPINNTAGTAVTGVGVVIGTGTYPASTGVAGDWFEIANVQLEEGVSLVSPRGFEKRLAGIEASMQYYYAWGPGVEAVAAEYNTAGNCVSTGNVILPFQAPVAMRVAPLTGGLNILTAGGYKINTAAAQTAVGTITVNNSTTQLSTTQQLILFSNAACTTTVPYNLVGTATTGVIIFSADP